MSYRCCDCGETKATKCDLEAHLNADHIGWTPYQCFYCCQQGVSTRKPNKELLRDHVAQRHPDQQFTFLCTDDHIKEDRLKDMLNRSMTNDESSLNVTSTLTQMTTTAPSPERISPFIISLSTSPHPQPKEEILMLQDSETHSVDGVIETSTPTHEQRADDIDVKPNFSVVGNCRPLNFICATCQESVPRNLVLIRDHVKLHFKEKTGCVPTDLTKLLPNLQQIYCQLLMTSFPSIGASIMDDEIQNCTEETIDQRMSDGQPHARENRTDSISQQLAQLSSPDHHSLTHNHKASVLISCDVCNEKFASTWKMHCHRARKHGIHVRYHCKQCKCDLNSGGTNGYQQHLRHKHLYRPKYECNLCGNCNVRPGTISHHDRQFHGGLGKAEVINNRHQLKAQLETLKKELIIDLNHRSTSWNLMKSKKIALCNILKRNHPFNGRAKSNVQVKSQMNPLLSCEICNKKIPSLSGLKSHRNKKHGILVKWYCKRCNVNVSAGDVNIHLLTVHMGNQAQFECSLCENKVDRKFIKNHDKQFHGGHGEAKVVNKLHHFEEQLEVLRDKFIIDLNSSSSGKNVFTSSMPKTSKPKCNTLNLKVSTVSTKCSTNFAQVKASTTNPGLSCDVCNKTFSSVGGVKYHRFRKHGISVNSYCKHCRINLVKNINLHVLRVHLGQMLIYQCSLCNRRVMPRNIDYHDKQFHGGMGKALIVNNLHRYKEQVDALRRKLIIDLNSSYANEKAASKKSAQRKPKSIDPSKTFDVEISQESSKVVDAIAKRTNNILTCQICNLTFSSLRVISIHRTRKHGIFVDWYCTQCKINLKGKCLEHLLMVHLDKNKYVCSICGSSVNNKSSIAVHDQNCHNGLGRARAIYNPHHYQKELEELRDALLIDLNAMVKVVDTVTLPHKPSFHKSTTGFQLESENSYGIQLSSPSTSCESKVKIQSKSVRHITTDNLNWLKRFKQSQKRKQKQSEILTIKRSAATQQWSCKIKQN